MTSITLSNINGLTYPYDIYVCDVYGNNCGYIAQVNSSIPPTIEIVLPPPFDLSPSVGIKIITSDGCERFKVINCYSVSPPLPFISIWDTTNTSGGSSLNNQIQLPLSSVPPTYYFTVDWGDGNSDTITSWNQLETLHTYSTPGIYTLTISGIIPEWSYYYPVLNDSHKLISITQWGCLQFGQYEDLNFYDCINLDLSTVNDVPNLSSTIALNNTFDGCTSLTSINNSNSWDISNVQYAIATFASCLNFNSDISSWDTSNMVNMNTMFSGCFLFNSNISSWNLSNCTDISSMFRNSTSFNQPIGTWNVSGITTMYETFRLSTSFNQDISSWDTSSVTNMVGMFRNSTSFNQNIGTWDVRNVTDFNNFMLGKTFSNYSTTNLDSIYNGWSSLPTLVSSININFGSIKYTAGGSAGKSILQTTYGWTITDGGI